MDFNMADEPTNGVLAEMIHGLKVTNDERHAYIIKGIDEVKDKVEKTIVQTTKTNGRVTLLEEVEKKLSMILDTHEGLLNGKDGFLSWKDRSWGIIKTISLIAVPFTILIGWLFTLYVNNLRVNINTEVSQQVVQLLEEKYDLSVIK
jgi:hypothetical protein